MRTDLILGALMLGTGVLFGVLLLRDFDWRFWLHAMSPVDLCRGEHYCRKCGRVMR